MGKRNIKFWALLIAVLVITAVYLIVIYPTDSVPVASEYFDHTSEGATDCADCHRKNKPGHHFDGQCSYCHDDTAWNPAFFDHTFPMDHEGANWDCRSCHSNEDYQNYTCYSCHEHTPENIADKHIEEGIPDYTNCVACHTYEQEPEY